MAKKMPKFALVSDLHLDCYRAPARQAIIDSVAQCNADYLLIAGDLCEARHLEPAIFGQWSRFKQIAYVAGNHEFYNSPNAHSIMKAMEQAVPNLTVLKGGHIELDGITIAGHALWHEPELALSINDAVYIADYELFIAQQYKQAQRWLKRLADIRPDIILTHHLPSYACIAEQYKNSPYNCFFVHEGALKQAPASAKYWCFGHTHFASKLELKNIVLACNPYGYAHERAKTNIPYKPAVFEL